MKYKNGRDVPAQVQTVIKKLVCSNVQQMQTAGENDTFIISKLPEYFPLFDSHSIRAEAQRIIDGGQVG